MGKYHSLGYSCPWANYRSLESDCGNDCGSSVAPSRGSLACSVYSKAQILVQSPGLTPRHWSYFCAALLRWYSMFVFLSNMLPVTNLWRGTFLQLYFPLSFHGLFYLGKYTTWTAFTRALNYQHGYSEVEEQGRKRAGRARYFTNIYSVCFIGIFCYTRLIL